MQFHNAPFSGVTSPNPTSRYDTTPPSDTKTIPLCVGLHLPAPPLSSAASQPGQRGRMVASPSGSRAQLGQRALVLAEEPHDVGHPPNALGSQRSGSLWERARSSLEQQHRRELCAAGWAPGWQWPRCSLRVSCLYCTYSTAADTVLPGAVREGQPHGCVLLRAGSCRGGCCSPLLPAARLAEDAAPMPLCPSAAGGGPCPV